MKTLARIIILTIIISCILMLSGCSTKTPTETIVSESVKHIDGVLDYAENNIADTPDTVFLKEELKACKVQLISCDKSCSAELKAEKNNTAYWKLACGALFSAIGALLYLFFKRK